MFIGANVAGWMLSKTTPAMTLTGAFFLQGLGLLWWSAVLDAHAGITMSFVLPGMLWAFCCGIAVVRASVACTAGVEGHMAGAVSGLNNTTLQIGAAIGVALLSTLAGKRTASPTPLTGGANLTEASTSGHALALVGGVGLAVTGLVLAVVLWTSSRGQQETHGDAEAGTPVVVG